MSENQQSWNCFDGPEQAAFSYNGTLLISIRMCVLLQDIRGNWHIISHNQGTGNVCHRTGTQSCGAHLFSANATAGWRVSPSFVYDTLDLVNEGVIVPATRQRPQLVLDQNTRAPLWLFNGAAFYGQGNRDLTHLTHTYAFEFIRANVSNSSNEFAAPGSLVGTRV